jgi:SET domain-containing protein
MISMIVHVGCSWFGRFTTACQTLQTRGLACCFLIFRCLCSCDGGNLEAVLVTIKGYMLPRVALFAAREIQQGEELSFAYCHAASDVDSGGSGGRSRRPCHCGTQACSGYLPSAL